jgi:hemerythrin superfamily protein
MAKGTCLTGRNLALIGGLAAGGAALITLLPAAKRRAMKVTNILMKDHRLVSGMIRALELTPRVNGIVRKSLFNQIRHSLLVHSQAEEEVFYPAVRNLRIGQSESLVSEANREHGRIRDLLNEIDGLDPISDEFDTKVADLKSTIQHHVEEEEGTIFPLVERQWTSEQLEQSGRKLHQRKRELKKSNRAA